MRMAVLAVVALLPAFAFAETKSTRCQTAELTIDATIVERRLIACGDGFADNLLWHLDRSDSIDGTLDGKVTRTTTGRGALIYFIDTGVLRDHEEFTRATGSNVIGLESTGTCPNAPMAPCWFAQSPTTLLIFGHGTGAASVAAGQNVGVAPDAWIVATQHMGTVADMTARLREIITHAYDPRTPDVQTAIINISGGIIADGGDVQLDALIRRMTTGVDANGNASATGKRFLFVTAAGNKGDTPQSNQCGANDGVRLYPASLGTQIDGVVSVGGIDRNNTLWSGACEGAGVEVAGPAADIFVASIGTRESYRYKPEFYASGTSWSTPYVSGMAARLLESNPSRTPAELEALLKTSPSAVEGVPVPVVAPLPRQRAVRR